jgi:hypothetical protein
MATDNRRGTDNPIMRPALLCNNIYSWMSIPAKTRILKEYIIQYDKILNEENDQ